MSEQSEREMLEWAARAYWGAEIDDVCSIEWDEADQCVAYTHADNQDHNGLDVALLWNPLTDSGQALDLAIRLQLTICNEHVSAGEVYCMRGERVYPGVRSGTTEDGDVIPSDYPATRRAIVLAAAAIGRAGQEQS